MKVFFSVEFLKKILLVALVFIFLIAILNYNFIWKNIKYTFIKPEIRQEIPDPQSFKEPEIKANMLLVPSLGINAPIVYVNAVNESQFQAALGHGVVHYPGTAKAGEVGNVYVFGHSSDLNWAKGDFKTVFALLPRVELGSEIIISDENGRVFTYIVKETFIASSRDLYLLKQDTGGKKILTLQTSWPLGTALKRFIVQAEIKE